MTKAFFILFVFLFLALSTSVEAQIRGNGLPLISAHRGASRVAPENTKASFLKAIAAGADFIEIDVRTTTDGEAVAYDIDLIQADDVDAVKIIYTEFESQHK